MCSFFGDDGERKPILLMFDERVCARAYTMRMGGGAGNLKHLFEIAPRNIKVIFVVPHTPHHIEHKKLDGILCVLARCTSCRKNNSSVLPNGCKRKNGIYFKAES